MNRALQKSRHLLLPCALLFLAACDSSNTTLPVIPEVPPPAEQPPAPSRELSGVIENVFPTSTLPTGTLPSTELDIATLDTTNFTSIVVQVGDEVTLTTELSALQEVYLDPTQFDASANPNAVATGVITVNLATGDVSGEVTYDGFDENVTMVHIHDGFAGSNGPVVIGLEASGDDRFVVPAGSALTSQQLGAFGNGKLYLNLHSTTNAAGELRGQLVPQNVQVLTSALESRQENPPVESEATGRGYLTVNTDTGVIWANALLQDLSATMAHIHSGIAGANGPVVIGLEDVSGESDAPAGSVWRSPVPSSAQNVGGLIAGNYYFNIHSEAFPGGELRGQLAGADVNVVRTELQGQQEVPAVTTEASGQGYLTINTITGAVAARANVDGVSATMAHIHDGFAGANGGVLVGLEDVTAPDAEPGTAWASAEGASLADVGAFNNGRAYFNIHSAENPGGELRGQLAGAQTRVLRSELSGNQQNPPVDTASTGTGYLTVNTESSLIWANVNVAGFTATMAHVHQGVAGANGPVIVGLDDVSADIDGAAEGTRWRSPGGSTAQNVGGLIRGNYYFNVHSETNPSGEVRGQLVGANWRVLRTELSGAQEVPPVETAATAIGYVTLGELSGAVNARVTLDGASATMAHIHRAYAGSNGPVLIGLEDVSADAGAPLGTVWASPEGAETLNGEGFLNGGYYFNVHSADNPSGEVRGQFADSRMTIFRTALQPSQVIGETIGEDTSLIGVGYVTHRSSDNAVAVRLRTDDVVSEGRVVEAAIGREAIAIATLIDLDDGAPGQQFGAGFGTDQTLTLAATDVLSGNIGIDAIDAENADGTGRGQILPSSLVAIHADLAPVDEAQTLNATGFVILDVERELFESIVRLSAAEAEDRVTITRTSNGEELFELTREAEDSDVFTTPLQPPVSVNGLQNGAYSFAVNAEAGSSSSVPAATAGAVDAGSTEAGDGGSESGDAEDSSGESEGDSGGGETGSGEGAGGY